MDFVADWPQNYELGEDATTLQALLRHADAKNNATPLHQEERSEREVEEGDEPARASVQEAAKARRHSLLATNVGTSRMRKTV
jgi:hypothetical protein